LKALFFLGTLMRMVLPKYFLRCRRLYGLLPPKTVFLTVNTV